MSGNICEWCYDWNGKLSTGTINNPFGADSGTERIVRGGVFFDPAASCSVSFCNSEVPSSKNYCIGIRVVRSLVE